jgi:hypothetical protein
MASFRCRAPAPAWRPQRLHQKLRVDELIRKQRIVSIVELRSHFHGTGGVSIWLSSLPPGRLPAF